MTDTAMSARAAHSIVTALTENCMSEESILSKNGRKIHASMQPARKHPKVNENDSMMYLPMMRVSLSPSRRLVAISLARFPVCATVRLI